MNSANFSVQSSLEANFLNIQLEEPINIDEIAMKTINNDCPDFLIPFQLLEVNGSTQLRYKLINTIALEYIDTTYTKKDFIKLFMNLLNPLIKGNEWFLDYHCFCIDPQYVYIDRISNLVLYIYVPEASYKNTDQDIFNFIKNTFNKMTITDDPGFQVTLFQFFIKDGVTLIDLYKMLQNEQTTKGMQQAAPSPAPAPIPAPVPVQPVVNNVQPQPINNQPPVAPNNFKPAHQIIKKEPPQNIVKTPPVAPPPVVDKNNQQSNDDIISSLFGNNPAPKNKPKKEEKAGKTPFSLFGGGKKKDDGVPVSIGTPNNTPINQPQVNNVSPANYNNNFQPQNQSFAQSDIYSPDSDVTMTFTEGSKRGGPHLELVSSAIAGAPSRIDLDFTKEFISIGRASSDEVQPDIIFPRDFTFIGRKHARISRDNNGKFFIIDLGSKNHTFVDGTMLVPNQMYELVSGKEIVFTESTPVKYRVNL